MMRRNIIYILLTPLMASACLSGCDSDTRDAVSANAISLEWIEALGKSEPTLDHFIYDGDRVDLGSFGFSRDYVFAIRNHSGSPIDSVEIDMDTIDPGFSLATSRIERLLPVSEMRAAGSLDYLRIDVQHGHDHLRTELAPLVGMGSHQIRLKIRGWTPGSSVPVTFEVVMDLEALVVSVSMTDSLGFNDFSIRNGSVCCPVWNSTGMPPRILRVGAAYAQNDGNVPIQVDFQDDADEVRGKWLLPGDTLNLPIAELGILRVGRSLAARDHNRLSMSTNGNSYVVLVMND